MNEHFFREAKLWKQMQEVIFVLLSVSLNLKSFPLQNMYQYLVKRNQKSIAINKNNVTAHTYSFL